MSSLFKIPERAVFSDCGRYRYALWREWSEPVRRRCLFVMLNPSTADSERDDPTIRRCIAFAKSWGFDALDVANMFAWRATDPRELWKVDDRVGPLNDEWIEKLAARAGLVVLAWGNNGNTDREDVIVKMLRGRKLEPKCLELTDQGSPVHPLYQPADRVLIPYPFAMKAGEFVR